MLTSRLLALTLLASTPLAFTQSPAAAPQAPAAPRPPRTVPRSFFISDSHSEGGMGSLPPGTWWRNPGTVKDLNLSADQQKRLDDTFRQSRIQLIDLKASLEKEQLNLEPILNSPSPDFPKALDETSRIADLRAGLEKANAKMLLGLRAVLTADQWTKLQTDPRSYPFTGGGPSLFRGGEPLIHSTTTCTSNKSTGKNDCTVTTVTPKLENGRTIITTCVTSPGESTPKCATTHAGSSQSFDLALPWDGTTPPPATFMMRVPRASSGPLSALDPETSFFPAFSIPAFSMPAISMKEIHIPAIHFDAKSFAVPAVNIPAINIPAINIPAMDFPATSPN